MNHESNARAGALLADEAILDLYWQRSERAITETEKKYKKYLYTIAYNILHDRTDSEDCLVDTYVGAWNAIPPQRPSLFRVFLSRITRNTALTTYKKNTAKKRGAAEITLSLDELGDALPQAPSAEEEYLVTQLAELLNGFIKDLPERDALIFICRYFCADRISTIASLLGVSERTVFTRLSTMRASLKAILEKEGYFDER